MKKKNLLINIFILVFIFALSACGTSTSDSNANSSTTNVIVDIPVHSHSYTSESIMPTCTEDGYTLHKCACGYEYKDTEVAALGHTYTDAVIDPTASDDDYTERVCNICGFRDKLADNTESGENEDNSSVEAGVFGKHPYESTPVYNGDTDYSTVVDTLNGYLLEIYGLTFYRNGLGQDDNQNLGTAKIVQNSAGEFGITIIGWRHSYDSSATVNQQLNAVLEAMYYFTGSEDVAYALWTFTDDNHIQDKADTNDYGFRDIERTSLGWLIEMNEIQIEIDNSVSEQCTYWFK